MTLGLSPTAVQAAPLPAETLKAQPKLQNGDDQLYGAIGAVEPNVAYTNDAGGRVEVYTSAGSTDGSKADWRAVNEFSYLINSVPKGKNLYATVFNSLYDLNRVKLVNGDYKVVTSKGKTVATENIFRPTLAFQKQINQYDSVAEARKYVHVIGAKRSMTESYKAPSSLGRLLKDSGVMRYCSATSTGACITTSYKEALMHSKYALFEQAADSTGKIWDNVIWVTSANLNGSSGGKKSNTAVAIFGDAAGYQGLLNKVWNAQRAQKITSGFRDAMNNGVASSDSEFAYFPSPRKTDFEARTLKAAADVSGKTNCKAYLAHSLFNSARVALLNQLSRLENDGCDVKILLGDNAIADVVDAYFGMATDAREVIDRVEFGEVHDKAITVSYTAGGNTYGTTWGGSSNANGTSLEHDELAFRSKSLTVTRAVEQQLERLYELIRGGATTTPVSKLEIAPATTSINVGSSRTLKPRITPTKASVKTVTWSSSDPSIVSVNANTGKVTALAVGSATITGTSLSGNKSATAVVNVTLDQAETGEAPASRNTINSPPTLSMDVYQQTVASGESRGTDVVVTWGSGIDITGKVALQSYHAGKWSTKRTIKVTKGRGTARLYLKASRAWRVRAVKANGATIGSSARYSKGYSYSVVRTRSNTSTPRLYAPSMVRFGDNIPFLVTWAKKGGGSSNMRLQVLMGRGWVTKLEFKLEGGTQKMISAVAAQGRRWRVVTGGGSTNGVYVSVRK